MRSVPRAWSALGSVALACAMLAESVPALAQSDEQRAAARALATQGAQAFSEERWQDAVDLFDRAEALIDAPTHLLFSARAHAKLHHYVKARELYLRINRQQLAADAPRAFRDAQTSAGQELKDVEPHIGQLTIVLRGVDAKLAKVTMDGSPVPAALVGVARPIDPGEHQIQAEAPGFSTQASKVSIGDGAPAKLVLELKPGESAVSPPSGPTPSAPAASAAGNGGAAVFSAGAAPANDAAHVDATPRGASTLRVGAYVAFGVAAVGAGAGTFFLLSSASKRADADKTFQACGGATGCTNDNPLSQQVTASDRSAHSAQTLGIVGLAVGGVALGTGVTLLVLGKGKSQSKRQPAGLTITPRIGLGSAGLSGSF